MTPRTIRFVRLGIAGLGAAALATLFVVHFRKLHDANDPHLVTNALIFTINSVLPFILTPAGAFAVAGWVYFLTAWKRK